MQILKVLCSVRIKKTEKDHNPFISFNLYSLIIHHQQYGLQIERSEFDEMILNRAIDNGANVLQSTKATNLIKENNKVIGIEIDSEQFGKKSVSADVVVDASGRNCFASLKNNWMELYPSLNKIALWTYYENAKNHILV